MRGASEIVLITLIYDLVVVLSLFRPFEVGFDRPVFFESSYFPSQTTSLSPHELGWAWLFEAGFGGYWR